MGRRIEVSPLVHHAIMDARQQEDRRVEQDFHFYLRLNADEFPYIAHESWLVSGAASGGRYVEAAGSMRRSSAVRPPATAARKVTSRQQWDPRSAYA